MPGYNYSLALCNIVEKERDTNEDSNTVMQALALLQLAKRHVYGHSNVEQACL